MRNCERLFLMQAELSLFPKQLQVLRVKDIDSDICNM